jgi:hypothetical protein
MLFFNGTWFLSNDSITAMLWNFWAERSSNDSTCINEFPSVLFPESVSSTEVFCFPDVGREFFWFPFGGATDF